MKDIIFYIEDHKTARDAFADQFRSLGIDVHTFEKGDDAKKAIQTIKPQLIILATCVKSIPKDGNPPQ